MTRICPICGNGFSPVHKNHKYCSPECARTAERYSKRRSREKDPEYGTCRECGKVFKVDRLHRNYCSQDCRIAYYERHNMAIGGGQSNLSPDYIPIRCRRLGQTSCFTCTLPQEECHGC